MVLVGFSLLTHLLTRPGLGPPRLEGAKRAAVALTDAVVGWALGLLRLALSFLGSLESSSKGQPFSSLCHHCWKSLTKDDMILFQLLLLLPQLQEICRRFKRLSMQSLLRLT